MKTRFTAGTPVCDLECGVLKGSINKVMALRARSPPGPPHKEIYHCRPSKVRAQPPGTGSLCSGKTELSLQPLRMTN